MASDKFRISGHVGLTLVDDSGKRTQYDYGHALANQEYREATSPLAKALSKTSIWGFGLTYLAMASYITFDQLGQLPEFKNYVAGQLTMMYAAAAIPAKATILKREEKLKPRAINRAIPISEEQYHKLKSQLESGKSEIYTQVLGNCVDYTKRVLRQNGVIDLPRRIINTPNSMLRQLDSQIPSVG